MGGWARVSARCPPSRKPAFEPNAVGTTLTIIVRLDILLSARRSNHWRFDASTVGGWARASARCPPSPKQTFESNAVGTTPLLVSAQPSRLDSVLWMVCNLAGECRWEYLINAARRAGSISAWLRFREEPGVSAASRTRCSGFWPVRRRRTQRRPLGRSDRITGGLTPARWEDGRGLRPVAHPLRNRLSSRMPLGLHHCLSRQNLVGSILFFEWFAVWLANAGGNTWLKPQGERARYPHGHGSARSLTGFSPSLVVSLSLFAANAWGTTWLRRWPVRIRPRSRKRPRSSTG